MGRSSLPVPLQLAHILHHRGPIKSARLLLQPFCNFLAVLVQIISGYDVLIGPTGREQLIDGGATANIDQGATFQDPWHKREEDLGEGREGGKIQVYLLQSLLPRGIKCGFPVDVDLMGSRKLLISLSKRMRIQL